jgi:hypothetical protein
MVFNSAAYVTQRFARPMSRFESTHEYRVVGSEKEQGRLFMIPAPRG